MYCKECGARLVDGAHYCQDCGAPVDTTAVGGPPVPWAEASDERPDAEAEGSLATTKRARRGSVTCSLALLGILLSVVGEVFFSVLAMFTGSDVYLFGLLGSSVVAGASVCALGGASLLDVRKSSMGWALRAGWWVLAVSVGVTVFDLVGSVANGVRFEQDWLIKAWYALALCACIGFSEEAMFRGLLLGGLLDVMGKDRRGVIRAVLLSSVLFGAAHIEWWDINYADPLQLAQAVLKILQTGMMGFFLAALTVRTKSIIGPAVVHGLADFVIFFYSYCLLGESLDVSYVSSGSEGVETTVLYIVMIVLYIPMVVQAARMLKDVPAPDYGALHKQ